MLPTPTVKYLRYAHPGTYQQQQRQQLQLQHLHHFQPGVRLPETPPQLNGMGNASITPAHIDGGS